ncbi:MAG: NAD(P)/FAD-dependent oxidoreductase [Myxococcota bacterium]
MSRAAQVAVVGGGVVGLACAAALARAGHGVVLLERRDGFGREGTSRNSEVLHAGLYYPEGSLKARLCVRGRELVVERCLRLRIPHRILGKVVVAAEASEVPALESLCERGRRNGALGLELLDAKRLAALEPDVRGRAALWSPATGIVDAHGLALSYAAEAEAHGAVLALGAEVLGLSRTPEGYRLDLARGGRERERLETDVVVNAAGLAADRLAAAVGLDPDACGYRHHPCKGDYFALAPSAPFRFTHLVYPLPSGAGLGIHATLDLEGRIRFGPDAEYVETLGFDVDARKRDVFCAAIRRYAPSMQVDWLSPDFAGMRPKLAGPGEAFRDFVVVEESDRGLPGFVNLLGIESPGLTAAPAVAERVVSLVAGS